MIAAMLGTDYRHGNSLDTRLMQSSVKLRFGTLVSDVAGGLTVAAQQNGRSFQVQSSQLIAATGAIERASPLPPSRLQEFPSFGLPRSLRPSRETARPSSRWRRRPLAGSFWKRPLRRFRQAMGRPRRIGRSGVMVACPFVAQCPIDNDEVWRRSRSHDLTDAQIRKAKAADKP
jgi:hypothetical protein